MALKIENVRLDQLKQAKWRFSENLALRTGDRDERDYTAAMQNIALHLKQWGQVSPIHVRHLDESDPRTGDALFEIVDGHVVVDAARQLKWKNIEVIVHPISENEARLLYVHFNLNRADHYHVKIMRVFKQVVGDTDQKVATLKQHVAWPEDRIRDYVEIAERDDNWQRFMFISTDDGNKDQVSCFDTLDKEVPDHK